MRALLSLIPPQAKAVMLALVVTALVSAGWALRGLVEDSKDLAELRSVQQALEKQVRREAETARRVEELLGKLHEQNRRHNRELLKITGRPVYQRDCVDDDGLRILQEVADGGRAAGAAGEVRGADEAHR